MTELPSPAPRAEIVKRFRARLTPEIARLVKLQPAIARQGLYPTPPSFYLTGAELAESPFEEGQTE